MERKLITLLNQRKCSQTYIANENIPRDFITLMQKTKEFRDLSVMAIGEIYRECQLIELHAASTNDHISITDQYQLDFYYLLKGECKLIFDVTKILDKEQQPEILLNENFTEEQKAVLQLGMRLKDKLIKPYFQTELIDQFQEAHNKLNSEDRKFQQLAQDFLKDPDHEAERFQGESWLKEHQYVSNETIKSLRPNYDEYYAKVHDIVTNQLQFHPFIKLPRKVLRYDDRLVKIQTQSNKSYLIRLSYKQTLRILQSFWSDFNNFADLVYSHMPLISTYTLKQKHKILLSFQEEIFQPNQPLFKEGEQLKYVYLVAEGEIRLFSTSNPFTKQYYKKHKMNENSDQTLRNASGLGHLSKTIVENNIGKVIKGQWLGEEYLLLKLPLLYSAVAMSQCKVLKMPVQDFQTKFPKEVQQAMELKTLEKMDWIKQRLEKLHSTRREIQKMEPQTETYEKTVNHIKNQYPTSNSPFQQQVRKTMLDKASNNPYLLLFTNNQRLEKIRQKKEEENGIASLRTVLFNKEKQKKQQSDEDSFSSLSKTWDRNNSLTTKAMSQCRSRNNQSMLSKQNKTEITIDNQTIDHDSGINLTSTSLLKGKSYFCIRSKISTEDQLKISNYKDNKHDNSQLTINIPSAKLLNQDSQLTLHQTTINTNDTSKRSLPYINQVSSQHQLANNQKPQSSIFTKRSMSVHQSQVPDNGSKSPLRYNQMSTYHMYEFIRTKMQQKKRMSNAYTLNISNSKYSQSKMKLVPVYNGSSPSKKDQE